MVFLFFCWNHVCAMFKKRLNYFRSGFRALFPSFQVIMNEYRKIVLVSSLKLFLEETLRRPAFCLNSFIIFSCRSPILERWNITVF